MKATSPAASASLSRAVSDVEQATREDLKKQWLKLFGREPPANFPQRYLILAISYRLQEEALGGLRPSLRRRLLQIAEDISAGKPLASARNASPGTVLIREWQGTRHTVTVLDKGFAYQGKHCRSLTEIARTITGTHQSGPMFFGLKTRAGK